MGVLFESDKNSPYFFAYLCAFLLLFSCFAFYYKKAPLPSCHRIYPGKGDLHFFIYEFESTSFLFMITSFLFRILPFAMSLEFQSLIEYTYFGIYLEMS